MKIGFDMDGTARLALAERLRANRVYPQIVTDEMRADMAAVAIDELSVPTRVGPSRVLRVTPPGDGPRPLFVNLHGGGFIAGHRERDTAYCAQLVRATGALALDIDYRLAPEHPFPTGLHECHDVVAWAFGNAAKLGVDPRRVLVGGHSAGGNFATVICIMARASGAFRLAGQLLDYPLVDCVTPPGEKADPRSALSEDWLHAINVLYAGTPDNLSDPLLSPARAPVEALVDLPPAIILIAGHDPLRHEARRYAARLIAAGVDVEVRQFANEDHGFVGSGTGRSSEARKAAFDWVNRIFGRDIDRRMALTAGGEGAA